MKKEVLPNLPCTEQETYGFRGTMPIETSMQGIPNHVVQAVFISVSKDVIPK